MVYHYGFALLWKARVIDRPGVLPVTAGCSRGSKRGRNVIRISTRLLIATRNCAGLSNFTVQSFKELGIDLLPK